MEDQAIVEENPSNKNRNLIIAVVAALVLCCCCLVIAGIGFYSFFGIGSSSTSGIPEPITDDSQPSDVGTEVVFGEPPAGGLGNDILKNSTWQTMAPVAMGFGCTPVSEDSSIDVLQQPDKGGVWVEKWTVACDSGDSLDFEVEFILDDTGTTYNITPLQ